MTDTLEQRARDRRVAEVTTVPMDTMDRLVTGRATEGDQMLAYNALAALQAQQPDPCPQCPPGAICKKPSCGRLVSQQPGAQAVAYAHFADDGTLRMWSSKFADARTLTKLLGTEPTPLFAPPQPRSIPEPSGEDLAEQFRRGYEAGQAALRQPVPDAVRELQLVDLTKFRGPIEALKHFYRSDLVASSAEHWGLAKGIDEGVAQCDELLALIASQQESRND